jgi:hypothetical protein
MNIKYCCVKTRKYGCQSYDDPLSYTHPILITCGECDKLSPRGSISYITSY